MPWNKINFEDSFGMKEEDFKTQLKAGAEAKAAIDELKTTVNGFTSVFDEIKQGLAKLQERPSGQPNQPQNGGAPQNTNTQAPEAAPKLTSFYDDEDKAFMERARIVNKPLLDMTMEIRADQSYNKVKAVHSDFHLFEEEIQTELKKAPLELRGIPDYIENAYSMVKGRHTDEIAEHRAKRQGKYFMEGGGATGNTIPGDKPTGTHLSDEEAQYAEKFGLKPEEYNEAKGRLRFV